ncbi:hypothetical protein N9291_01210 [bacterium]|nr:hypothetical protein [bacterium]
MKALLLLSSSLFLISCAPTVGTAPTATDKRSLPTKSGKTAPDKQGGAAISNGVNKTINNVNRAGYTIRSVQAIQSLF